MHRVLKSTGSWYLLEGENGQIIQSRASGKLRLNKNRLTNPISVGDYVVASESASGDWQIEKVLPRKNYLLRKSNKLSSKYQILASNIDQIVLMASFVKPFTPFGFIDRMLVSAESFRIPVALIWNKKDLYKAEEYRLYQEAHDKYQALGYSSYLISLKNERDSTGVRELFQDKTTLIAGNSGVGKSTLINCLFPEAFRKTADISDVHDTGKHTTTFAEMLKLEEKTYLIDSPGIRDFGLADLEKAHISHYFPEMRGLLGSCRFADCLHLNEPGCSIHNAVNQGLISADRYRIYAEIMHELEE